MTHRSRSPRPRRPAGMAERADRAVDLRPLPAGPRFVAAGSYEAPRGRSAAPHRYAVWKLTYYLTGSITATVDEAAFTITPGTMLVVPPRGAHAEDARTAYSNVYVLVHAPDQWPWPRLVSPGVIPDAERCFTALLAEATADDVLSADMTQALITKLDVSLRRCHGVRSRRARIVAQAERLIEERYSTPLRVSDIARQVAVSTSTLRALFAAERGCSPQQRLREVRLRQAEAMLRDSDQPIDDVAVHCGFNSASHLARYVRHAYGVSPGALRSR